MRIYVLSECYTSNDRSADGELGEVLLFKSKEEAIAELKRIVDRIKEGDGGVYYYDENVKIHNGDPKEPTGTPIANAKVYNWERDIFVYKIT